MTNRDRTTSEAALTDLDTIGQRAFGLVERLRSLNARALGPMPVKDGIGPVHPPQGFFADLGGRLDAVRGQLEDAHEEVSRLEGAL